MKDYRYIVSVDFKMLISKKSMTALGGFKKCHANGPHNAASGTGSAIVVKISRSLSQARAKDSRLINLSPTQPTTFNNFTPQLCLEDVSILHPAVCEPWSDRIIAPPQLSAAELKAQEQEATLTVQKLIFGAVLLYLCMPWRSAVCLHLETC